MNEPSEIRLEGVDLHYRASAFEQRSLKSAIVGMFQSRDRAHAVRDVHALRKVSIFIGHGERVGVLGHNGAGKTTLLRTIAGLYPISAGRLSVKGSVRALMSLGLGFEPYATGRENILYRGLLLGQRPKTMRALEPEIIAFADLGEFIDYPLKTYSAGMQVRLAFAISTAITGGILLLDEVIGAGDATFRQKARARVVQLIDRSEIVVLASHDTKSLQEFCRRGLVLHHGVVVCDAPIGDAIAHYQALTGVQP